MAATASIQQIHSLEVIESFAERLNKEIAEYLLLDVDNTLITEKPYLGSMRCCHWLHEMTQHDQSSYKQKSIRVVCKYSASKMQSAALRRCEESECHLR